jgi:predicted regulator of Ras-like GTPase activity (Roadblock/LC7/MglB family)
MSHDAVRRWSDELARDPNSLAFLRLADALRRDRQLSDARRVALRGLERHPYLADAHDMLARVYADGGDDERARDEWEMALQIDPAHTSSLKGLGFLAFRANDLPNADRYLRSARELAPDDEGLARAHQRVVDAAQTLGRPPGAPHAETRQPGDQARALFAPLLGDADRTALLLDKDGLVLAGMYLDERGNDAAEEVGAELSGVSEEAGRALRQLGLGAWILLLCEAEHATVGLAPARNDAVVLVAAARDTHVGFVRRLLTQARERALAWLEEKP